MIYRDSNTGLYNRNYAIPINGKEHDHIRIHCMRCGLFMEKIVPDNKTIHGVEFLLCDDCLNDVEDNNEEETDE